MKEYFTHRRTQIVATLEALFDDVAEDLERVNSWGRDAIDRLRGYMEGGKMIRGALVFLGEELFQDSRGENASRIAAAMELLQAFLLIHDDIMDRDDLRRGRPSMHAQYRALATGEGRALRLGSGEETHLAEALAICVGDISAFLAVELTAAIEVPEAVRRRILALLSREIVRTGVAQMQDVYNGYVRGEVEKANILSVYTYKTGRYTFSLPLMLGALLAGRGEEEVLTTLGEIGERLGRIFQIRDDQLGLFGTAEEIGKPVGSDVSEDKKTVVRALLFEAANPEERSELQGYFGSPDIGENEIARIRQIAEERGVLSRLREEIAREDDAVRRAIASLSLRARGEELLIELSEFNRRRSS
ncbi:MAG: polyprenyl synthetase family protein [Alkalispirochaetaceae bacterium]